MIAKCPLLVNTYNPFGLDPKISTLVPSCRTFLLDTKLPGAYQVLRGLSLGDGWQHGSESKRNTGECGR